MSRVSRPQTASPTKSPKKQKTMIAPVSTADYENLLNDQQHTMSMQVSEKEIEIERLKTTVASLNHKCAIVDDHLTDVQNARGDHKDSEGNRVKLQEHIVTVSVTVEKDMKTHKSYQSELIDKISSLQDDLEKEKQRQYQKELGWRKEREDTQIKHHNQIQQVNDEKERVRA